MAFCEFDFGSFDDCFTNTLLHVGNNMISDASQIVGRAVSVSFVLAWRQLIACLQCCREVCLGLVIVLVETEFEPDMTEFVTRYLEAPFSLIVLVTDFGGESFVACVSNSSNLAWPVLDHSLKIRVVKC
jgi:hypothetical protein